MRNRADETIPVVDFSALEGKYEDLSRTDFANVVQDFGGAMTSVGFVYIKNHGVDMAKIDHINKLSKDFFNLPPSVKNKYVKPNPAECFQGYAGPGMHKEDKNNSIEYREVFDIWGFEQYEESHYPSEVPNYKSAFDAIRPEVYNLTKKLLHLLGIFLQLDDEETFVKYHSFMDDPTIRTQSQFRTLHYFPMDPEDASIPPGATRCGEHTDWGSITALWQDMVGGLEVKRRDGSWIEATPLPDTTLVNAGQFLEIWSAGEILATPHRVRILNEERTRKSARQSFVWFINPDGDTVIKPIAPRSTSSKDNQHFNKEPIVAYDDYKRQIKEATNN